MSYRYGVCAFLLCGVLATAGAAEYFVGKRGNDASSGREKAQAFLTIQRGLNALQPGDTLTIGPGEYAEYVKLLNVGSPDKDTLIRAEIPGTVFLRGDQDADLNLKQVNGRRFVYAADWDRDVLSVLEVDSLKVLAPAADVDALEFGPGRYFYDAAGKKLYLSSTDFQPPDRHRYTLGQLKDHGFLVLDSQRVVIDGLAACGFLSATNAALLLPSSGILLRRARHCVVRRCTAFLNGSGITMNSETSGQDNVVESCRAYGNQMDGIVGYNPSGETIRDSQSFLNRLYGARYYGARRGDSLCLLTNVLAWGNPGGDYWFKGSGLSGWDKYARAERCIAMKDVHIANLAHCITGGGPGHGGSPDTIALPDGAWAFENFANREFADPLNMDFRLQGTSPFRQSGEGYAYKGPFPFETNVFYVTAAGNDGRDGLSMSNAWKTLGHAFPRLRPGDTLYVAGGRYAGAPVLSAKSVRIRGRGMERVVIDGPFALLNGLDVSLERLYFAGPVNVEGGRQVAFDHCLFTGGEAVTGVDVRGLRLTHGVLAVPLKTKGCSDMFLSGNLYAAAPAVQLDSPDALQYSDYNSYPEAGRCIKVGWLKTLSLKELQPGHDAYSRVVAPDIALKDGAALIKNGFRYVGRGPLGTSIGPYREWQPEYMQLAGPIVRSVSETTANIEWWTTLPATVELSWGDTPSCTNKIALDQSCFFSYSLVGLKPGKTYYVRVTPTGIKLGADPGRRLRLAEQQSAVVSFAAAMKPERAPRTYYVSTNGSNTATGLGRETAWHSLQHAADQVRPGDTVIVAGGVYPGTVYFRATGEKDKPISFKAIPGEKAMIDGQGETLKVGLVLFGKHYYRFDGLYMQGFAGIEDNMAGAENGAMLVKQGSNLQVTRCRFGGGWGPGLVVSRCPTVSVRNCVFTSSMGSCSIGGCRDLSIEHCVFMSPLISHLTVGNAADEPARVASSIFGENTRGKAQVCFVLLSPSTVESNNCFYVRWPENERAVINWLTLPEYQVAKSTDSFAANPQMPGAPGWIQGWGPGNSSGDFDQFFATNPELVKRGVGLQPAAFRDFHFTMTNWVYDVEWAENVITRTNAAWALVREGNDAAALAIYTNLVATLPMQDRLKTEIMEQAALCAHRMKDYDQAMALAGRMPLKPLAVRRQLAFMAERGKWQDMIARFGDKPGVGVPHLSWSYPETEDALGDTLYYRALAYAETGNLAQAEKELRTMTEKRVTLAYSPGESVHEMAVLRLADFYRKYLKDDNRALQTYSNILTRTMQSPYRLNIVAKPAFTGGTAALVAATQAASEILRKQGNEAEALRIQMSLLKAQAEAFADLAKRGDMIAAFRQILACKGVWGAEQESCVKRIEALQADDRKTVVRLVADETSFLESTRTVLTGAIDGTDAEARATALRAIIAFAPLEMIQKVLTRTEGEAARKAVRERIQPTLIRMRTLDGQRQWKALIDEFKDASLAGWPEDMAREALRLRGVAYHQLKDGKSAEAELKKAIAGCTPDNQDPYPLFFLAENYRQNLKDDPKALEAYLKVNAMTKGAMGWMTFDVALKASGILRGQGRNAEALSVLESVNRQGITGDWRNSIYSAYFDTLLALGRKADVIAECGKMLQAPGLSAGESNAIVARLKGLHEDPGQPRHP